MVISVAANVNDIARLGRDFPWIKPSGCPFCGQPLWWHGFVLAYFSCLSEAVWLRRVRCSCCYRVHRLKPAGYWRQFRSPIAEIFQAMACRSDSGRWHHAVSKARQRQWWRRLMRVTHGVLGLFRGSPKESFYLLIQKGYLPVSLSFHCDNPSTGPPPYRSVSLPEISC